MPFRPVPRIAWRARFAPGAQFITHLGPAATMARATRGTVVPGRIVTARRIGAAGRVVTRRRVRAPRRIIPARWVRATVVGATIVVPPVLAARVVWTPRVRSATVAVVVGARTAHIAVARVPRRRMVIAVRPR